MNTFIVLLYVVVCGLSLWVGLYVRLRSAKSTLTLLITCAAIGEAVYFFWNGLVIVQPIFVFNRVYLGLFWWSNLVPLAFWYHAGYLIWRHVKDSGGKAALVWHVLAVYALAVVCSVLRTTTDTILTLRPNAALDVTTPFLRAETLYFLVMLCVLISTGGACIYLFRAYTHYRRFAGGVARVQNFLRTLAIGAGLFCSAASFITLNIGVGLRLPQEPAYILTIVGYILFSFGITRYSAWIGGTDVGRDLWYSLAGITIVNLVYGGVFVAVIGLSNIQSVLMLQLLVCLTTFTHLYSDRGRTLLSRLFLTQAEQEQRTEALSAAATVGTAVVSNPQNTQNDKAHIEMAVREALTHFTETAHLTNSPLLRLALVTTALNEKRCEDTPRVRLECVQALLIQHVESLCPTDGSAKTNPAWRYYTILYYGCIKGLTKKQRDRRILELEHATTRTAGEQEELAVLEALNDIPSATFFRLRNQALNAVAEAVYTQEKRVQRQAGKSS